jgi:hypothetical protein
MAEKRSQKGGAQRVKKVLLPLPEDLHHKMHLRAVELRMTMREFITEAIRQALEKGGEKKH